MKVFFFLLGMVLTILHIPGILEVMRHWKLGVANFLSRTYFLFSKRVVMRACWLIIMEWHVMQHSKMYITSVFFRQTVIPSSPAVLPLDVSCKALLTSSLVSEGTLFFVCHSVRLGYMTVLSTVHFSIGFLFFLYYIVKIADNMALFIFDCVHLVAFHAKLPFY